MKIHEYQAQNLLKQYGIPVLPSGVADTVEQGLELARTLFDRGCSKLFVKAQVHAGGRGKAGGILPAADLAEAEDAIRRILGMTLITPQTGSEGKLVRKVMVVEASGPIACELYAGIVLDRQRERPVVMVSGEGGTEIEEVAAKMPERILKEHVHPLGGMNPFQGRNLAWRLNLSGDLIQQAARLFVNLYQMFIDLDCSQVEINPLVLTRDKKLIALDAKINFDDSALFKQVEIASMRDLSEESNLEVEASRHGLNYIKLDGNIGCMVNGAGLAMATMDIIKYYGGAPANFLDVGGGATEENITEAFKIILADKDVRSVLVNIFGGIVRCDRVARGIITAAGNANLTRPLVVRLVGTNADEGNRLLRESGLSIQTAEEMADAAQKVIAVLGGGGR
ncbi:ADP-forming succinate--CoA ligase subunit beta [bacterium]|nr:ADP-forming succinate--CoA ligase subunit beta [candidate division CSSED10-310 bacterium]